MKRIICYLLLLSATFTVFAQEQDTTKKTSTWTRKGLTGLNFSQAQLINWSAGGENTMSGNIYLNGQLNYKKGHWAWDNLLNTEFGMMYTTTNDWQKSVDKLQFTSKVGFTHNDKLYYSFLVDFSTQYAKGYKNPTDVNYMSNFMAPGYLSLALGIDYKPSSVFTVFYSPLTERLTFVLDNSLSRVGAFGVDTGDKVRAQTGMYFKAGMDLKVTGNIRIISTLDLFTAYDKTFGNIVIDWNTLVSMKINKYLTTSLNLQVKYDDSIKTVDDIGNPKGPRVQFKELLGLGISYSF